MSAYILRRLLQSIPTLFGITIISFLLVITSPGDPITMVTFNPNSSPEGTAALRRQLGLDQPPLVQYFYWLVGNDFVKIDVNGDGIIDTEINTQAMALLEVDDLGLDPADRMLLTAIIDNYNGGPVGVDTIAALTAEERGTIEDFYEPYLMQIGLIERTPRGRKVTPKAYRHLGKAKGKDSSQQSLV